MTQKFHAYKSYLSETKIVILIILASLIITIIGINWGLPSWEGWAADELIPARVLNAIEQSFSNGWHYKYPPVHFYLLAIVYSPFLLLAKFQIISLENLSTYTALFILGRFLSVAMAAGLLYLVYLCSREINNIRSGIFSVIIISLTPTFIYYSKISNLDIPYCFWFIFSLLFYLRILKYQRLSDYLGFALTAAIAVATKDQAYAFYILTPLFLIWQHYRHLQKQDKTITIKQALVHPHIIAALITGISIFLILHNIIFNFSGFLSHINLITAGSGKIRPRYEQSLMGQILMHRQTFFHLKFIFGYPFYLICLAGLSKILIKWRRSFLSFSLLIPIFSYYLFFICIVSYNPIRFLIPMTLVLAIFGGNFVDYLLNKVSANKLVIFALVISFLYSFSYGFSINWLMLKDSRYFVESWLENNVDKQALILNTGIIKYTPRLDNFNSRHVRKPTLVNIKELKPDYIIVSSSYDIRRFTPNSASYEFFDYLSESKSYQLVLKYKSQIKANLLNNKNLLERNQGKRRIYSNFDKINPEISIYQRKS